MKEKNKNPCAPPTLLSFALCGVLRPRLLWAAALNSKLDGRISGHFYSKNQPRFQVPSPAFIQPKRAGQMHGASGAECF
jgi:hypothetical protein